MSNGNYGAKIAITVIILIIVLVGLGLLLYFYVIKKKISVTPPSTLPPISPSSTVPPTPAPPSSPKICPVGDCIEGCSADIKLCQTGPGEVYNYNNSWYINIPNSSDTSQCSPLTGSVTGSGVVCDLGDKGIATFCPDMKGLLAGGCYQYKP